MNAVRERQRLEKQPVAFLRECEANDLLEFEPPAAPRQTFPTMLMITLAIVVLVSTSSAILLLLRT